MPLDRGSAKLTVPKAFLPFARDVRYRVAYGGRGSGKSTSFARLLIARAYTRKRRILCAREFQSSIADSVHRLIADQIYDLKLEKWFKILDSSIVCTETGSEFLFKGLRHSIQSIRSLEGIDDCWVEEASTVSAQHWRVLIPTIRKLHSGFWISFNPDQETDPTYERFVLDPPPSSTVIKTSWRDNPRLSPELDAERTYMLRTDPDAYDWVWEGNTRHVSDAVIFKNKWRLDRFETPENARFFHGADWGFSQDPTVLVRCWVSGRKLMIDQEAYGHGIELDDIPTLWKAKVPSCLKWPIYADDARPETISHVARKGGLSITGAKKWKGSVEDGIAYLRSFEEIVVHERCTHTAQEMRLYSYKVDQRENILPIPLDKHNHCIAKGELIETARGQVPVEQVVAGDLALTRAGYRRVYSAGLTDECRPIWELRAGGRTLRATADHKVLELDKGMTRLDALRYGDRVLVRSQKPSPGLRQSSIAARSGGAIRTLLERLTAPISGTVLRPKPTLPTCTERSGKITSALSQMGITSTIGTGTRGTTLRTISNALRQPSTQPGTHTTPIGKNDSASISRASVTWQQRGMALRMALQSIAASVPWPMLLSFLSQSPVVAVGPSFPARSGTRTSTAPTPASPQRAELPEWMTRTASVPSAVPDFGVADTIKGTFVVARVVSVRDTGMPAAVYDLSVEFNPEFVASGIVVFNCIDALRYSQDGMIKGPNTAHLFSQMVAA